MGSGRRRGAVQDVHVGCIARNDVYQPALCHPILCGAPSPCRRQHDPTAIVLHGTDALSSLFTFLFIYLTKKATWATICILIQLGVNDPNSWVGVILLIVGWVLLPILCFFLWRWLKSKAATSAASSGLPLASAPSSPPPPPPPPGPVIVSASASASASASSAPAAAPGPVVVIQHIHVSNPPPPSPHYHYPPPSPSAPPRPSVPPVFAVPPPGLSVHSAYPVDD